MTSPSSISISTPLPNFGKSSKVKPWQSIPGWTYCERIYQLIARLVPNDGKIVEVGSFVGRSAVCMAYYLNQQGSQAEFYCVDHWKGSEEHQETARARNLWEEFQTNIEPWKEYITPIIGESVATAATFADESIDFLWLDASHDVASVMADIRAWYPKIKHGGYFGGDDYTAFPGVECAVNEYFDRAFILITERGQTSWLHCKE